MNKLLVASLLLSLLLFGCISQPNTNLTQNQVDIKSTIITNIEPRCDEKVICYATDSGYDTPISCLNMNNETFNKYCKVG